MEKLSLKKVFNSFGMKFAFVLLLTIVISSAATYGFFVASRNQKGDNSLSTGCFNVEFTDGQAINLDKAMSISDAEGQSTTPYTFTLKNTCDLEAFYYVILDVKAGSFSSEYINYSLNKGTPYTLSNKLKNTEYPPTSEYSESYIIGSGTVSNKMPVTIDFRAWINSSTTYDDVKEKSWNGRVRVVSTVNAVGGNAVNRIIASAKDTSVDYNTIAPSLQATSYSKENFNSNISYKSMTDSGSKYYIYSENFEYDSSTKKFSLVNPKVVQYSSGNNALIGKYISSIDGYDMESSLDTSSNYTNLDVIYKVGTETQVNYLYYLASYAWPKTIWDTTTSGVYKLNDEDGVSYYFRGAVDNNYVKFGKNAKGQDMWWRIIRINGDKTVRMIYDGTEAHTNGEKSLDRVVATNRKFNSLVDDAKYAGYMYGPANTDVSTTLASSTITNAQSNTSSSTIKGELEDWYRLNILETGYDKYISYDGSFCNDRSTPVSGYQIGAGKNTTFYGAYDRLTNKKIPTMKCDMNTYNGISVDNDKFTATSASRGNKNLTYPVGLLTLDEAILGGAGYTGNNYGYYLNKGTWYWTMSPKSFDGNSMAIYGISDNGAVSNAYANGGGGIAPVINLSVSASSSLKGLGTISDPYTILISE